VSIPDSAHEATERLTPLVGRDRANMIMSSFYGAWSFGFGLVAGAVVNCMGAIHQLPEAERQSKFQFAADTLAEDLVGWVESCLTGEQPVMAAIMPHIDFVKDAAFADLETLAKNWKGETVH